jgi:hypothetical protein
MSKDKTSKESVNSALRKTDVSSSGGFEQELQNNFGASDYDMMMIFGTSASEQAAYLKNNPHLQGIVEPMEGYVTSRLRGRW